MDKCFPEYWDFRKWDDTAEITEENFSRVGYALKNRLRRVLEPLHVKSLLLLIHVDDFRDPT